MHNLSLHDALPILLAQQGKLAEAIQSYERLLQLKPEYAEAYNDLGNALVEQGKLPEAIQNYERALQLKRSEEHTSELQSPVHLVCRLLLEKKNYRYVRTHSRSIGTSVQSCKPECPERHDNTILDGGKSCEPLADSARACNQVRRLVTGTAN